MHKDKLAWLVSVFFLLVSCAYFYTALDGSELLTERDLAVFFIPPRVLWVKAVLSGEFPLWNPYIYSGHPLFATLQPGVLYPINALFLLLPFDLAFNWSIILHFPMAGVFSWLLLERLGASFFGALAGSLVFMLGGYLFSAHNVMSTLFTVTWSPLALYLFIGIIRSGSFRQAMLVSLVLAAMLLGGGIEGLYATLGLLLIVAVVPSAIDVRAGAQGCAPVGKRLALYFLAVAVFILLSMAQILPFAELAGLSTRAGGLSFAEATTWSFDLKDFMQFIIPDPFGYGANDERYWANQSWLKTVYIGACPLILAAFFYVRERRKAALFTLVAAAFLLLAMGGNTFFYQYLHAGLPFLNKFRYPVKFLFVAFIYVSIAAGLGLDAFMERADAARRVARALMCAAFAAAMAFGLLNLFHSGAVEWLVRSGYDFPDYNHARINLFNAKRLLFFFIVFSVAVYLAAANAGIRRFFPPAAALIILVDLFFAHNGFYTTTRASDYHADGEVTRFLKEDPGLYRVFVTPRTRKEAAAVPDDGSFDRKLFLNMVLDKERLIGYNIEHGVFDIGGIEVLMRYDYTAIHEMMATAPGIDSTNILKMLNVKYVVSIPKIDSPDFRLRKVVGAAGGAVSGSMEDAASVKVYEYRGHMPRFTLVDGWKVVKEPQEYVEAFFDKGFSPERTALLEREPWEGAGEGASGLSVTPGSVEVVEYSNNAIELKVRAEKRSLLLASEAYYPGWRAYVDGAEAEVLRADYVMRGVVVEPGEHMVRFEYCPRSFHAGLAVSSVTAFGLVGFGVYSLSRRRRGSPDA